MVPLFTMTASGSKIETLLSLMLDALLREYPIGIAKNSFTSDLAFMFVFVQCERSRNEHLRKIHALKVT